MDHKEFEVFLEKTLNYIRETLGRKGGEYTPTGNSRFHSFKEAGKAEGLHPLIILDVLKSKHRISEKDLTAEILNHGTIPSSEFLREKIGDQISYL
ncbi:MAG: hypothetical protein U9Q21_04205, partial [Candidatus Auribacterota bacterium]|nr:hypothetical protein [Candidatus Auribacterota bacterium]